MNRREFIKTGAVLSIAPLAITTVIPKKPSKAFIRGGRCNTAGGCGPNCKCNAFLLDILTPGAHQHDGLVWRDGKLYDTWEKTEKLLAISPNNYSPLERVRTRHLLLQINKAVKKVCEYHFFEPNDKITHNSIKKMIEQYLDTLPICGKKVTVRGREYSIGVEVYFKTKYGADTTSVCYKIGR